jgi:hypothetical protein
MTALPTPDKLAELVSTVTTTMLGLTFHADADAARLPRLSWRTAVLPIPGRSPITVGLSSDESGCAALSSAMFACGAGEVDASMIDDSLCELVNMTAGLVKATMSLDQALGLPRVIGSSSRGDAPGPKGGTGQSVVLKADQVGLILWICEGVLP